MQTFEITTDTLTKGKQTFIVFANTYADALLKADAKVDALDGIWPWEVYYTTMWANMPVTATFDELCSWQGFVNYTDNGHIWKFLFRNGVSYTGLVREEIARICAPHEMLDRNLIN